MMAQTMNERTCLVTGASGGIGRATARQIAGQGATVVLVGRDETRTRRAVDEIREQTGNTRVDFLLADLSRPEDIRRLAATFLERYPRLHVLVNNVGGVFINGQVSPDGVEMTLALNHLGYYLLTHLLVDRLKASAPARIVNVSSFAHYGIRLDTERLRFAGWRGYKRSKLANVLFTYELARRLEGSGVTANALSPGFVASNFGRNNRGLLPAMKSLMDLVALSCEQGARTSTYLALSPEVEGVTGQYFARCRPRRSSAASYDRETAARLWEVSAQMTGVATD